MPDGVIFDMDGLMFDSERIWTKAWAPTLKQYGFDEVPEGMANACRGTGGSSEAAIIQRFVPVSDDVAMQMVKTLQEVGSEYLLAHGAPKKPGLDELLGYLAKHEIPMAVASSSPMKLIEGMLDHAQVRGYFKVVVSGANIAHPKPAPDVFLKAADELGVDPARTIVCEDSISGIRAAYAGGFIPVMVPDMVAPTDEMHEKAAAICKTLGEIPALIEQGKLG